MLYIGDLQATECHSKYPSNATDATKYCVTPEASGSETVLQTAMAVEMSSNGSTCNINPGATTTTKISTLQHHKMIYTAVYGTHKSTCANTWRFHVYTRWISGRSVMIQNGPYGQGLVRPL